jgi:hypothetical protein
MKSFEAGKTYAQSLPGTEVRMLFACQSLITHPDSGRTFASGFTSYEGSSLWRDVPVNYRNPGNWELLEGQDTEPYFEPGVRYEFRPDGGSRVGAEFLCAGVMDNPISGTRHAVGYWRQVWASGKTGEWELRSKPSMRDWYPAKEEK